MAATLFIDGATKTVSSIQPNLQGRAVIEITIPDGLPLSLLSTQLISLVGTLQNTPGAEALVVSLTIG